MRWPTRLSQQLILSLTVVVALVVVTNGVLAVRQAETQLQASMLQGAEQVSGAIASSTWHAMLADERESAYEVMKTIAREAAASPDLLKDAPHHRPVRRLDEVKAAKEPIVKHAFAERVPTGA